MKVTGIDAVYYVVRDFDNEVTFYRDLLGAEPTMQWPGRVAEWTFADGNSFGLYKHDSGDAPAQRSGSAMFAVADVAQAAKEAMARGVNMHENGAVTDTPSCHMAFGEDPEGHQFVLHKRKSS